MVQLLKSQGVRATQKLQRKTYKTRNVISTAVQRNVTCGFREEKFGNNISTVANVNFLLSYRLWF